MTDQELKDLVASLAVTQRENERILAEERKKNEAIFLAERQKREEALAAERQKREEELKQVELALAAERQKREETLAEERRKREEALAEERKKLDVMLAEERRKTEEERRKTERMLTELGKQIGGLGNKFGTFTEGLAMPSVKRLLFERFGCEFFMPRLSRRSKGESLELDALGLVNGDRNEAYIVEIKSHLRAEALDQLLEILGRFRSLFPEYSSMRLFGLIAAADANEDILQAALDAGIYVLTFEGDLMRFHEESGFVPKAY